MKIKVAILEESKLKISQDIYQQDTLALLISATMANS
jgi:hypothetical protein